MKRELKLGGRRAGGLLGRPQLLAVAGALLVAVPVLVLGQMSEDDTRARLAAAQVESAAHLAGAVSSDFSNRTAQIGNTLVALVANPRPETSPIGLAVRHGDVATLQAIANSVQSLYPRSVLRSYIAVVGQAGSPSSPGINAATIVAASPAGTGLVGKSLFDPTVKFGAIPQLRPSFSCLGFSDAYPGTVDAPSRIVLTMPTPQGCDFVPYSSAVIEVEVDVARTFAESATPFLAGTDDAYLLDGRRQLIGRAHGPTAFPLRELSGDPVVQLIGPPSYAVAREGARDPLGGGTRLIASVGFAESNWSIVVVRETSGADREVDAALGQLAVLRLIVVGMLLGLAYLAALMGSQLTRRAVDQERLRLARDLHDLLGHSLSLIAIKSQLARRLLPSAETSPAANEIADVERVARESLEDVRHAVDGYRQPSLRSALAGARVALSAAGIDSTIEAAAGPLAAPVDAALAWAVREGVTNVIRHSRAARCSIRLTRDGREANLEIIDDGPPTARHAPGNGLRGLEERAAARGGHADAGPLPQGGFRLRVSLPLDTP